MSGNTYDERVTEFLTRTGTVAIQKPFRAADVRDVVGRVLEPAGAGPEGE
jgi:hypothetical protein